MNIFISFILVGIGGGIGAMLRYGLTLIPFPHTPVGEFPWMTMIINFVGSFLIGFIAEISLEKRISAKWTTFIKVGILGGFTTFSSFTLATLTAIQKGRWITASTYVVCSVLFSLIGCFLGQLLAKQLFKKA